MEKRKFKFNYVDVIILLLVIAVFFIGYKFMSKGVTKTSNTPDVSFTVEVTAMPDGYGDNFKVGDEIRDAVKGDVLGVVTGVESVKATELTEDRENGAYVVNEIEDFEDAYITIKGKPTSYGKDIMIAQQEIKVGTMVYFKKPGYVGRGYIVRMSVEEDNQK